MATAQTTSDGFLVRGGIGQDLQGILRQVGLAVEYWLPKLQEHLGVTCAEALQYLESKDLQKLESQVQHTWEKKALEKMLKLAHSTSLSESQKTEEEITKRNQEQEEQRGFLPAGKQQWKEAVGSKEAEQRQALDIPNEQRSPPQTTLKEVLENKHRQLNPKEGTLAHRQNLSDRELVRWTSGGLALRGIYKTSSESGMIEKREEILRVPKEFSLSGPELGPRMETKEFTSSEDESSFTQNIEQLSFSVSATAKGGGWGVKLEAGGNHSKHSDSKKTQQSHSQHSYFCSVKLNYIPLASCRFPVDQLQLSKAALQELQCLEGLLAQSAHPDRMLLLRHRIRAFFHRFGSHANQGPLHLGGIYWWKAVSEGFQSEQLAEVKKQSAEALECYVRGSYSGFGVKAAAGVEGSASHSNATSQKTNFQNLQTKVQLSTSQTGGPPEANGLLEWKAGLVASNQTWCVIDRGFQLVPVWDIILFSHRSDFEAPLQVANCLRDSYIALTGLPARIQNGLSAGTEAKASLEVKSWKVSDHEEQQKNLGEVQKQYQSPIHEKTQPLESHDNENNKWKVIENRPFRELLQRLGLERYYPKKMYRENFNMIHKASVHNTQPSSEQELPFCFLEKLLMMDYGLRYLVFKDNGNIEMQDHPSTTCHENKTFDPYEDLPEDSDGSTYPSVPRRLHHIHPMDIQMAILHCADDFARQCILEKLAICQFALPLLIPDPCSSQIEFSLWSLSQIRRSWQQSRKSANEKDNYKNQQMYRVSTPIVSFIRIGNGFSASKSQIMNCLVSQRKHDVFFHRHSRESSKDCLLMEGVVEICWFCPGGEEGDRFDNCLTFTNLHGDAKKHEKQFTFLQEVSSILVVLMSTYDDNEGNRELVHDLCQSSTPVIFLLDDKEKIMGGRSAQRVKIGIRSRNEAELTEELATTIRGLLERSDAALSLQACAQIARKQGFIVDEDQQDCKEAKEKAESLMAPLREMQLSQVKEILLPFQGELWNLWCKTDKELYHLKEKGNWSIEQHKSEGETENQRIQHQQLTRNFSLNDFMRSVLEILQQWSENPMKLYFLQWLSVFLDDLTVEHLQKLNISQNTLWSNIQTEKQKVSKSNSLKCWQNDLEAILKEISNCNLGIEQLLRGVSQIYEALDDTCSKKNTLFLALPQIVADLMIAGVPIELMDGNISYVPLKWVAAVFDKVSERLGDKRLFVLSTLGLEGSGKSTLLNALFGLQVTVSEGRHNQGAYMQLLKVEETFAQELGFDFVLVVDTEGLRAPELNSKCQDRDNELATFVIGLGNLTLINIFGENPSEMQDILQRAVQIFLRMKQVNISPSCFFVHQYMGEFRAGNQSMEARRRLEQRLDEMAVMAAELEQCSEVTRFSDVIKFDVNTHVFYFAHLWDGNPPMAPLNPHYSHNVQELKSRILMTIKQESRGSIMKISDVKQRVQDLWKALVNENFIVSSRNTQEIMVINKLETMYNTWFWGLRSHVLNLQGKLINQIQNGKPEILIIEDLHVPVIEKYGVIQRELEKYFSEDPDREIMVQWKIRFENKLISLKDALIQESLAKVNEVIGLKKNQETLNCKMSSYKKELFERSRELALTVKGTQLSENELYKIFCELWEKWVSDVSQNLPVTIKPAINADAETILWEHFRNERNLVLKLKENFKKEFQIDFEKHVKGTGILHNLIVGVVVARDIIEAADKTIEDITSRFTEMIENIRVQHQGYNKKYFHEILNMIVEQVRSANSAYSQERFVFSSVFTFTHEYIFDLSCCLFQRASEHFREIQEEFKQANNPKFRLEIKKDDFFMCFKISYQEATSIKTLADFLWNKLIPVISNIIREKIILKIAGDMRVTRPAFTGNRVNLEKHILISLAEEENFDNYVQYFHHSESFFRNYIENHIQSYCSEERTEKMNNFLETSLDDIKKAILSALQECTAQTKDKSSTACEWLDLFCHHLESQVILPRKDLVSVEHQEIKDTDFLKEAMSAALDPAMKTVEQNCLSMSVEEMVPEIGKILSEHLGGCWKQCPFCGALCTNTIPTHDGDHSASSHRPQIINGWHFPDTSLFSINLCGSDVASESTFMLRDGRRFPYKHYRLAGGEFSTWSITPDSSTQLYWEWFICRFRAELEEKYQKKFVDGGEIPEAWTRITKHDVLEDLKRQ